MNILTKFSISLGSELGFKLSWKRLSHIENGHPFKNSTEIESFLSEKHPHTDDYFIFAITIRKCDDCGLIFFDKGLKIRRG